MAHILKEDEDSTPSFNMFWGDRHQHHPNAGIKMSGNIRNVRAYSAMHRPLAKDDSKSRAE